MHDPTVASVFRTSCLVSSQCDISAVDISDTFDVGQQGSVLEYRAACLIDE